jgi:hypothetical protein
VSVSIEATIYHPLNTVCFQNAANGGAQCNQIAVTASAALLAAAGPCDQQNNADIMMDLSKKLKSNQMISSAQIFVQQPRNSVRHVFRACGKRRLKLTLPFFVS